MEREIEYNLTEEELLYFQGEICGESNQRIVVELDDEIVSPESSAYAGIRILEPKELAIEIWAYFDNPPSITALLHEPGDEITINLPRVPEEDEDYLAVGRFIFSKFYQSPEGN